MEQDEQHDDTKPITITNTPSSNSNFAKRLSRRRRTNYTVTRHALQINDDDDDDDDGSNSCISDGVSSSIIVSPPSSHAAGSGLGRFASPPRPEDTSASSSAATPHQQAAARLSMRLRDALSEPGARTGVIAGRFSSSSPYDDATTAKIRERLLLGWRSKDNALDSAVTSSANDINVRINKANVARIIERRTLRPKTILDELDELDEKHSEPGRRIRPPPISTRTSSPLRPTTALDVSDLSMDIRNLDTSAAGSDHGSSSSIKDNSSTTSGNGIFGLNGPLRRLKLGLQSPASAAAAAATSSPYDHDYSDASSADLDASSAVASEAQSTASSPGKISLRVRLQRRILRRGRRLRRQQEQQQPPIDTIRSQVSGSESEEVETSTREGCCSQRNLSSVYKKNNTNQSDTVQSILVDMGFNPNAANEEGNNDDYVHDDDDDDGALFCGSDLRHHNDNNNNNNNRVRNQEEGIENSSSKENDIFLPPHQDKQDGVERRDKGALYDRSVVVVDVPSKINTTATSSTTNNNRSSIDRRNQGGKTSEEQQQHYYYGPKSPVSTTTIQTPKNQDGDRYMPGSPTTTTIAREKLDRYLIPASPPRHPPAQSEGSFFFGNNNNNNEGASISSPSRDVPFISVRRDDDNNDEAHSPISRMTVEPISPIMSQCDSSSKNGGTKVLSPLSKSSSRRGKHHHHHHKGGTKGSSRHHHHHHHHHHNSSRKSSCHVSALADVASIDDDDSSFVRLTRQVRYGRRGELPPSTSNGNRVRVHVYDLISAETYVQLPWGCDFPIGKCFNVVNNGLHAMGTGAYHCGLEVNGVEFAFGANNVPGLTGVFTCPPMQSPGYQYRTSLDFGVRRTVKRSWVSVPKPECMEMVISHSGSWANNSIKKKKKKRKEEEEKEEEKNNNNNNGKNRKKATTFNKVPSVYREVETFVDGHSLMQKMAYEYMGVDYDLLRKNCCTFVKDACLRLGVKEDEIPAWFHNIAEYGVATEKAAADIDAAVFSPIKKMLSQSKFPNEDDEDDNNNDVDGPQQRGFEVIAKRKRGSSHRTEMEIVSVVEAIVGGGKNNTPTKSRRRNYKDPSLDQVPSIEGLEIGIRETLSWTY